MKFKYIIKRFYVLSLVLCSWLLFAFIAQGSEPEMPPGSTGIEVKYFNHKDYDRFKFNNKIKFIDEITVDDLIKTAYYYELHYEKGNLMYAFYYDHTNPLIFNNKHLKLEKYELDSDDREVLEIRFMNAFDSSEQRICKTSYGDQIKKTLCKTENGEFVSKIIFNYKNNILFKESFFLEKPDKLSLYYIYDHKRGMEQAFDGDDTSLGEKEISLIVD